MRLVSGLQEVPVAAVTNFQAPLFVFEWYSKYCGSCTEFAPIIEEAVKEVRKLEDAEPIGGLPRIGMGKIAIDQEEGRKAAEKAGVLEEGLPNLRVGL